MVGCCKSKVSSGGWLPEAPALSQGLEMKRATVSEKITISRNVEKAHTYLVSRP